VKFILLVEGDTEKQAAAEFLKRWLCPQLTQRVGMQVVHFTGWSDFDRRLAAKARKFLDGPDQKDIIAVIGLLDLYGPNIYPGHATSARDRYTWGVKHFEKSVGRPRFHMYFAVHEFEAWLLSQPSIFAPEVKKALPGKIDRPEQVDFDEPPAKLLDTIYRRGLKQNYKKVTDGKDLFAQLDPAVAIKKCPYLKAMLAEMLALAKAAGL
jgi:hypothetical protein